MHFLYIICYLVFYLQLQIILFHDEISIQVTIDAAIKSAITVRYTLLEF